MPERASRPLHVRPALWELTRARGLEFGRQPGAIFWVFGFPVLMAVVLGLAFRSRPEGQVAVAVADGPGAERLVAALAAEPRIVESVLPPGEAAEALRTGKVDLVVEPAWGQAGGDAVVYRFDPARPASREARLEADAAIQRAAGRADPVGSSEERVSEPGARYIDFLIPGLIGLNLMGSGMWGVGFIIVVMRTQKLLKRFAATPMRRSDFMLGVLFSRLTFFAVEVAFLVAFGWLAFGVEVRGSWAALVLVCFAGAASFTGLALLVASRTASVEVASGLMNLVMLPMWLLSGSFFSYERFPEVFHPAIRALPLTAVNDALRAVMNEGADLASTVPELTVLAAWCLVSLAVALRIFRWR